MHQHLFVKFVPVFFCCFLSFLHNDPISEGLWKAEKVSLSDQFEYNPSSRANLEQIAEALEGSVLELRKNGRASFRTKVPQFQVPEARWSYEEDDASLTLTDKRNPSVVIMEFIVVTTGQNSLFYLSESPFVLEMNRVKNE
jgi:hypothetical protein